jgi:hypothetical protein
MMPSSGSMLFSTLPSQNQRPTSLVGSIVVHAIAAAVVWFSFGYKPPVARVVEAHYTLRQLDLLMPPEHQTQAPRIPYPKSHAGASGPAGHTEQSRSLPNQVQPGPQTLIQADLLNPIKMPQPIPVPQVVIWSPSKTVVKHIVPPLPEKPTAADVIPVLDRPNQELTLADVNLASSKLPSFKSPVAPSTTSPVTVHAPAQVQLPPASTSQQSAPPTPAAVLSLSDLKMKEGSAALPPVNESQASTAQGALSPGKAQNPSDQAGRGAPAARPGLGGAGQSAGGGTNQSASGSGKPETSSSLTDGVTGSDGTGRATTTPIALPRDGHFGSVIVNDALEQQFPELEGAWTGRLAYTAYLHVGLPKSWILQYSLPRNADAAAGGTTTRLEAPWPYNIVRPNLPSGSVDADAVMIRGFVDESGRFQGLTVVFPQPFASAQFVLAALQQWQFRPAQHNGQAAKVEILLIIPEDLQ